MAGNIVKWWKHKIMGGYKQFSVLQECTTDSEELIYPVRAPSSCSAPPDLLLTSEREQFSVRNPHLINKNADSTKTPKSVKSEQERVRLEEFTCDVSVEGGGKTPQPLQFSFTLYDLDGYGKITKDDIAGIVSTIYESIGKSVVVPHYGSKTINVRLTVSPDAKTKPTSTVLPKVLKKAIITPRRRIRPRKLNSEEDGGDGSDTSGEGKIRKCRRHTHNHQNQETENINKNKENNNRISKDCSTTTTTNTTDSTEPTCLGKIYTPTKSNDCRLINQTKIHDNIYESINNLKCCPKDNNLHVVFSESKKANCCPVVTEGKLIEHIDVCTAKKIENNLTSECNEQCRDCTINLEVTNCKQTGRKKVLRKSRSRKQKSGDEHPVARVRSLSVGNENCWNRIESAEECWKSSLRRHELIEIIRESMEKNRLCFQANRKPTESPPRHRHRSHTISKMIDEQQTSAVTHEANLCGYDSYLHATICSNVNNNHHLTSPVGFTTPERFIHNGKVKIRTKSHEVQRGMHPKLHNTPVKLNTAILNQRNPNLSADQKLSRTINHVEKWLTERDHVQNIRNEAKIENIEKRNKFSKKPLHRSKSKEELAIKDKNVLFEKLKITENLIEPIASTTPKKTFNKEVLISASSASRKKQANNRVVDNNIKNNGFAMEYASIPVAAEPIECENLLRASDEEIPNGSTTSSTVHRYVHEHIHHHYHHFENDEA